MRWFTSRNVDNISENLLTNHGPLFVKRKAGVRYGTIHWSRKIDTTCGSMVFDDWIAQVHFVYWWMMTVMNKFLVSFFGNEPILSMARNYMGPLEGNNFRLVPFWGWRDFGHSHRSLQLLYKRRWPCNASRALVSWYRTCDALQDIPPVLGTEQGRGGGGRRELVITVFAVPSCGAMQTRRPWRSYEWHEPAIWD